MLYTTLKRLGYAGACYSGMETLIASLPEDVEDTFEISLEHILESNGLDHAIWAMQATTVDCKEKIVLLACNFAKTSIKNYAKVYPTDTRPQEAIQAAEDFVANKISSSELHKKTVAAEAAAWSATRASASARATEWAGMESATAAKTAAKARAAAWAARAAESAAEAASARSANLAAAAAHGAAADSARSAVRSAAIEKNAQIFLLRISNA